MKVRELLEVLAACDADGDVEAHVLVDDEPTFDVCELVDATRVTFPPRPEDVAGPWPNPAALLQLKVVGSGWRGPVDPEVTEALYVHAVLDDLEEGL